MTTALLNGTSLYFETCGQGAPLLLLAGLRSDLRRWGALPQMLSGHFLVIMPDNRGVGRSAASTEGLSVAQMADDAAALLSHLGFSAAHVLGHSMGGFIAQELAIAKPQCVEKLVLSATASKCRTEVVRTFRSMAAKLQYAHDRTAFIEEILPMIFSERFIQNKAAVLEILDAALNDPFEQTAEDFARQVEALGAFDRTAEAATITSPALVVAGEEDGIFSLEEVRSLAAAIPQATFSSLRGVAHSLHHEAPEAFADMVRHFLA